jgi:hypothetical protein
LRCDILAENRGTSAETAGWPSFCHYFLLGIEALVFADPLNHDFDAENYTALSIKI